ncbi:MAG: ATP-grasp domain-containing protein [Desulfatitalea sp.]|nr:ATP-grasp domain-containing protein [Desulfatitalea sp.]NNJ99308.1 ATP-grasp domain-containing protein [Desulfatitalea sp.]
MKIGLTYDLRSEYLAAGYSEEETAEFDRDETITAIEDALRRSGHQTSRIGHAKNLMKQLISGQRWDLVFNIAEGLTGIGREAQVPAILDVYNIPYTFSDPLVMALTLHKGMTKRVLRDVGIPTPEFAMVAGHEDLSRVTFDPPFFIKPIAEGTGKGITPDAIVRHRRELAAACRNLRVRYRQPVLVERFLPGREFTVGVIGTGVDARILGTMEILLNKEAEQQVYSYTNKEFCEKRVTYRLITAEQDAVVREAEAIVLEAWQELGCRDAGRVDVRCDAHGRPQFMEVNPLAGIHPEHSDLPIICNFIGMPYQQLIECIVHSAAKRISTPPLSKASAGR